MEQNTTKNKKEKGISRIDSGSTHGWFVRGYKNGKTYSKLFSDTKFGGNTEDALKAAMEFRDTLKSDLAKIPSNPRARRIVTRDSRNTTGVLGVCRTSKTSPTGRKYECYSVSWRPATGIQKCTSFSIEKYGERKAFRLAVELRRKKMEEIFGASGVREINKRVKAAKVQSTAIKQVEPIQQA